LWEVAELAILLRRLKSEGHRALIFTQMSKSTYIRTTVRRCSLIRTVENTMHLYLGWMHVQVDVLVLSSCAHMWIYKHAQPQIGNLQISNNISKWRLQFVSDVRNYNIASFG
jgi:hypothetical protein